MASVLGEALQKALNYSDFVWKGEKVKQGDKIIQESEKLIDMTPERLNQCYEHCKKMLYSEDPKHLGRYNVLKEINSQINKCNVELFLRYCENAYLRRENVRPTTRVNLMVSIKSFIANSEEEAVEKGVELDWDTISISHLMNDLPPEFNDITINDVLEGCMDTLGAFDKQHLTLTFITRMGLWFTKAEEKELKGETNSHVERLRIAKERLHLPKELFLKFSDKGLSYHEMRAIIVLPKKQKYSDMTTEQLLVLRNKVLLRFSKQVDGHIYNWKKLIKQIEQVAKYKEIKLND